MLPMAHLTSHSRRFGCRWMITSSWLSWLWRSFLYSSVYSCPLLNFFCFCYIHIISVLYCAHLWMKYSLGISNFLKRSLVFTILLFSSISLHWSLRTVFFYLSLLFFGTLHSNGYLFPFLIWLSLLFFSQLFVRPCERTILPFCISFSCRWSWSLPPVQCQ